MKSERTFTCEIYSGGPIPHMEIFKFCDETPICVSIEQVEYYHPVTVVERGFVVRLIQYPRFPKPESIILSYAIQLASIIGKKLDQEKVSVITTDDTYTLFKGEDY